MKLAPAHRHGRPERLGVLLVNLGTPDAPTPAALRRWLREFLSDPRVVEIPRLVWLPILHGFVLRTRPRISAAKYASIWTEAGSPLKVWTEKQALMLAGYLGERGWPALVKPAMRYGSPAVAAQLDALQAEGATRILILPLYPQYSATTTASVFDAVHAWAGAVRRLPELRFVNRYHDDAGYIRALARRIEDHWQTHGRPELLLLSFHGLPERSLHLGDPYHCECLTTARLLAERLGLKPERVRVGFQSRFGKAKWLQPYTEPTLVELARQGVKRVDVACPGFTSDCLETLEEIAQQARAAFLGAGGEEFGFIPCLNDQHEWIAALAAIAIRHMQGWPAGAPDAAALQAQLDRAKRMGATA